MKKTSTLLLFGIFIFAFVLRVLFLKDLSLTFGYDQARDAYVSQQIINGDLKVLGPPASTPGLYHGVIYYYLLAPAYLLGRGSPVVAAYWVALLNAGGVFIVYLIAFAMTKKRFAGLLAAVLFAASFEATQYATWLSNPTLGVWTVPLIYLGLWLWLFETKTVSWVRKIAPVLCALGLGLSIQSEVFLLYHCIPMAIWFWFKRSKIVKRDMVLFASVLFASLSTMIIAEVKFGFKSISGVSQLLVSQDALVAAKGLGDFLLLFLNQLGKVFAFNAYPGNVGYGGVFILVLIVVSLLAWNKEKRISANNSWQPFLALWLLSHLTVVSIGGTSTPFLLVGIGSAVSIIIAAFLSDCFHSEKKIMAVIVLTVLLFGNMAMIFKENPKGSTIFAIQKDMLLKKQLALIDYTYEKAGGEPFSINTLTSPLWINIVWTYLYNWYGMPKYGYVPEWHGKDQVGQLATLPPTVKETSLYFLILEPMAGIPPRYLGETKGEEDAVSVLVSEKAFGELVVEERLRGNSQK